MSHTITTASAALIEAKDELIAATGALIEHSGNGWPLTPAEVSAAQRRWDEALDTVLARAMHHGQLYERYCEEGRDDA